MHYILKLRALSSVATTAIVRAGSRGFRNMVRQGAIRDSQRFPSTHGLSAAAESAAAGGSDPRRRFFERSWTLSGPQQLEKLKLQIPGVTFVSVDSQDESDATATPAGDDALDWVAKIRVTSDSPEALASIAVEARHRHRAAVYLSPTWSNQVPARGNLLTEIVLPRGWGGAGGMLRSLATTGQGLVVVEDDALALHDDPNAVVKLAASCGSRLAVSATRNVDVGKLQIAAAKRGEVHLQAPNVAVRGKLDVASTGAASVLLRSFGYVRSPQMSVAIAGDGQVRVHSAGSLAVESMRSAIAGAGTISVSVPGDGSSSGSSSSSASTKTNSSTPGERAKVKADVACKTHRIAIFGSGSVNCADVATEDVAVAIAGHAHVVIDATEELKVASFGTARVQYPHDPPRVSTRGKRHSADPEQPAALTDAEKSEAEQQRAAELQQTEDFWRSLPSRASALESAQQVSFERESGDNRWGRCYASSPSSSWCSSPSASSYIPWSRAARQSRSWRRWSWSHKA